MKKEMHGGEVFLWFMGAMCLFSYVVSILELITK